MPSEIARGVGGVVATPIEQETCGLKSERDPVKRVCRRLTGVLIGGLLAADTPGLDCHAGCQSNQQPSEMPQPKDTMLGASYSSGTHANPFSELIAGLPVFLPNSVEGTRHVVACFYWHWQVL